jgi:hypothetical protein
MQPLLARPGVTYVPDCVRDWIDHWFVQLVLQLLDPYSKEAGSVAEASMTRQSTKAAAIWQGASRVAC